MLDHEDDEDLLVEIRLKFVGVMGSVEWKNKCTGKSQGLQT